MLCVCWAVSYIGDEDKLQHSYIMAEGKGPAVGTFDISGQAHEVSARWVKWKRSFEYFAEGAGITDSKRLRALMLHHAGVEVQDRFATLVEDDTEADVFKRAIGALDKSFDFKPNKRYERYVLRLMQQQEGETVSQFVARMKAQAQHCGFADANAAEDQVCDQLVVQIRDQELRKKLLAVTDLTLTKALQEAREHEATEQHARDMNSCGAVDRATAGTVNAIGDDSIRRVSRQAAVQQRSDQTCHNCGRTGHFARDSSCPAKGKKCDRCGKRGHFAVKCRQQGKASGVTHEPTGRHRDEQQSGRKAYARTIESRSSDSPPSPTSDTDHEYGFGVQPCRSRQMTIPVYVGTIATTALVDSGATCNLMGRREFRALRDRGLLADLRPCHQTLYAYGATKLNTIGEFDAELAVNGKSQTTAFIVIKGSGQLLLGRDSALGFGVLSLPQPVVSAVSSASLDESFKQQLVAQYPTVFNGVGKLKGYQAHLHIDPNKAPVAQKQRRVPFALESKVKEKLDDLLERDIIQEAEGPTPWVSPVVVAEKPNGDIRLCVDMRRANEAIVRERHPLPTVDEIIRNINGSVVFSKIDLKWGFHQVELDEESRSITTFAVNDRLYQYKRLAFGISSAPELYQKLIRGLLYGLSGLQNAADDMVVYGRDYEEHDRNLHRLLQRLQENHITVNKDKCVFRQKSVVFYGLLLSADGVQPTEATVSAMRNAKAPSNASEVRSFLGTAGFSAKFIPDFATITEPLRRLTRQNAKFQWGEAQQNAFSRLKEALTSAAALAYFDPAADTEVIADASPVGLGAVLVQHQRGLRRPVAYASRALSAVEQRYSQTEKEALALVWACERFHQYLFGRQFDLVTDHKPLEVIYSARSKPSARIERWVLRLQPYHFTVRHIKGPRNIADCLSRLPADPAPARSATEEYVRSIIKVNTPRAMHAGTVREASETDEELQQVCDCLASGRLDNLPHSYRAVRHELTEVDGAVLRGTRLVIPKKLRRQVVDLAHEGHQGIVKTKERLRTKVWWPGMDGDAERRCRSCHGCQVVSGDIITPEVKSTPFPNQPWEHLAADLLGPLPSGEYLLVLVDYYSRYYEVDILKNITSETIIRCLSVHFARYGIPSSVRTDNGPQFVSAEFQQYLVDMGIGLRRTTPLWPRANGEVERQNRSLLKALRVAQAEKRPWKEEMQTFLLAYRSTRHSTTGQTPAYLMFGREIQCKLPSLAALNTGKDQEARDRDTAQKQVIRDCADRCSQARDQTTQPGDQVLLKRSNPGNKLDSPFHPEPHHVVSRHGDQVVVESPDGKQVRRNISFTKPLVTSANDSSTDIPTIEEPSPAQLCMPTSARVDDRPSRVRQPPAWMKDYVST